MIDLHCHILPALDDGALDLRDAIAMARQAEEDGIEAICATPHIRHDHDVRIGELAGRVAGLQAALDAEGIGVRILTGGEVAAGIVEHLNPAELTAVTLAGAGWILLEPDPGPLSDALEATVAALAEHGHRSLIAHPERHPGEGFEPRVRRLVERGALVQVTAAFVMAPETRDWVRGLAGRGLAHVLASDAHSSRAGRPVRLRSALEALGLPFAREAPAAIVAGRAVSPPAA